MESKTAPPPYLIEAAARARAARKLNQLRRWAEEMRAAGWTVNEPAKEPAPTMLAVLRWDRFPSWPSSVVGSIVDNKAEAFAEAAESARRSAAQGRAARFTVHAITWPPLADVGTGK